MTNTVEPIYVDTKTAARLIGYSPATLTSWRCRGTDGPPFYPASARKVVYKVCELQAFIEQHRKVPAAVQLAAEARA